MTKEKIQSGLALTSVVMGVSGVGFLIGGIIFYEHDANLSDSENKKKQLKRALIGFGLIGGAIAVSKTID